MPESETWSNNRGIEFWSLCFGLEIFLQCWAFILTFKDFWLRLSQFSYEKCKENIKLIMQIVKAGKKEKLEFPKL